MTNPLGVKNHSPLNMRPDGRSKWQGLASPPTMSVKGQGSYLVFVDPTYGWRAAALNLIAYQDRRTVKAMTAEQALDVAHHLIGLALHAIKMRTRARE